MKKNKSLAAVVVILLIALAQPAVYQRIFPIFTQSNVLEQLGVPKAYLPQSSSSANDSTGNQELAQREFDGQNQVVNLYQGSSIFSQEELSLEKGTWQTFSNLDALNRVGQADALLGKELMPTEERKSIAHVKPTGWKNKKITFNGKEDYLYNRSHLIGFQLTGENDNVKNLFTGTRALNANFEYPENSMVHYENQVANYIRSTGHHVRYRVTPVFRDNELVVRGIRIQAQSVEDGAIAIDVYIFNIQPGYTLDYATGSSRKNF